MNRRRSILRRSMAAAPQLAAGRRCPDGPATARLDPVTPSGDLQGRQRKMWPTCQGWSAGSGSTAAPVGSPA